MVNLSKHGRLAYLLKLIGVAALYVLLAKVDPSYFSTNGIVSIFWFPAGLALAVLLTGGMRYFPGVFFGVFLAYAMRGLGLGTSAAIALGSTLAPLLGVWLLARNGQFDPNLRNLRDYLRLVVLAGFFACYLSALNGVTVLLLSGVIAGETYLQNLLDWWMGDVLGIMLVTPLLLVWQRMPGDWLRQKRIAEAALVLGLTLLAGQVIFLDWWHEAVGKVALGYWMYLFVIWAAVRLGVHGVVVILAATALMALRGAVQGIGFFAHDMDNFGLANFWLYMMVLSIIGMMLATYFAEHVQAEMQLKGSEERYRQIIQTSMDGFWITDTQGRILDVNGAYCQLTGYAYEELLNMRISDVDAKETPEETAQHVRVVMAQGHVRFETRHRCKDGQLLDVEVSVVYQPDKQEGGRFFVFVRDITERNLAVEMLRKLSIAVEQSPATVAITDTKACIQYVNAQFTETSGYTAAEAIGQNPRILQSGQTSKEIYSEMWGKLHSGQTWSGEFLNKRKNGELYWEDVRIAPVKNPAGAVTHYVAIKIDITSRKQMEANNQQRLDELSAVYQLSKAVSGAESLEQVYEEAMESILRTLKADRVSILLFGADGLMHFKAWRNLSDTYRNTADGHSPWTQETVDPQPVLVDDIELDADWVHFLSVARAEGISAFGFIPLVLHGHLIGKFMVYYNLPHHFTEDEVRLAKTIAFHIAFATERKQAETELRLRAQLLDSVSDTIFLLDLDGNFVYLNEAAWKTRGYTRDEMMGISLRVLDTPKYEKLVGVRFKEIMEKGQCIFESEHRRKDGSVMPVEINARLIELGGQKRLLSIIRDITERKAAEQELRVAASAFETSYEAMVVTDAERAIIKINRAFTRITGYSEDEVLGKNPSILKSGRQASSFYKAMWEDLSRNKFWEGEIWNRRKSGDIYPEWLSIAAVSDHEGNVTHYIATFSDISKRKDAEARIHDLAFYDPLTKLPNRRLLQDRLRQALAMNARNEQQGALLFIDLDNFKRINDTHGHTAGDLLLSEAANRLQTCIREGDTAARLGGDEFVALLEGLDVNEQLAAAQAEIAGKKILEVIGQPYLIDGHKHFSTASIGITLFRGPVRTMEEMFKRADAAMYQAKTEGRNTLRFFDPDLQALVAARIALESDLRQAIFEQEQFQLYYQAQVDSAGRLIGAEALVRWKHPERGMVSPAQFIPLAEESGLILPFGHWIMATACKQLAAWAALPETAHLTLAVNVSVKQLRLPNFVEDVLTLVDAFGVDARNLKLEITEGMLLENVEDTIVKMSALEARGIYFSIDDFGTGYSSLSYLKRLPLHQLKIDQSFVRDVLTDPNDAAIARTIISLAQSLDLAVIAEGVETEAQREFLDRNGCHAFQGYLFSKPVPVKEFEQLVTRYPIL